MTGRAGRSVAVEDRGWSEDEITTLKDLWASGMVTQKIGDRMKRSKSSIVGKAGRLDLPARPSPIHRRTVDGVPPPHRPHVPRVTLPPLQSAVLVAPPTPPAPTETAQGSSTLDALVEQALRPRSACCWPTGEPGKPGFRFCDDRAMAGRPYCGAHVLRAYAPMRSRREDAA